MVKALIIPIIAILALVILGIIATISINSVFREFNNMLIEAEEINNKEQNAVEKLSEILDWWNKNENVVRLFIPHGDIREINDRISNSIEYSRFGSYPDVASLIGELKTNSEQIPMQYSFKIENIF